MTLPRLTRFARVFAVSASCFALACSASESQRGGPAGPRSGVPTLGGAGTSGATAGKSSSPGASDNPLDNPTPISMAGQPAPIADDCNKVEIEFAPRVPSVFILVDRSSSMFERNLWAPLKDGVLAVIDRLDEEIRFGFSSYTGAQ